MHFKKETERLTEKLVGYEATVTQLGNYVASLQARNDEEARLIKLVDEESIICAPVRSPKKKRAASKKVTEAKRRIEYGPHVLASDYEHVTTAPWEAQSPEVPCGCKMKNFVRLQNQFLEKVSQYQSRVVEETLWSADGLALPRKPLRTSVEGSVMNVIHSNRATPTLQESSR